MPGYNCSIKDRMLYASARNAVISTIENLGVVVDKKVRKMARLSYIDHFNKKFINKLVEFL